MGRLQALQKSAGSRIQRCGEAHFAACKIGLERIGTLAEAGFDAFLRLRQRAHQHAGAFRQHVVDAGMGVADRFAEFGGLAADGFLDEILGGAKRRCQGQRLVGQGIFELLDAAVEHSADCFGSTRYGLVDAREALHQLGVQHAGTLVEGAGEFVEPRIEGCRQRADGRLQLFLEEAGAQVEIHDGVVGRRFQALAEACAALVERRVQ